MKKILVVNNHGSTFPKLLEVLRSLKVNFKVIEPLEKFDDGDGVIISGGFIKRENLLKVLKWYEDLLDSSLPILGICLGHKILGYCYGSKILKLKEARRGFYKVNFLKDYKLAPKLKSLWVYENHRYTLYDLPPFLENYASSEECSFEALKHKKKEQYSVQFHPEIFQRDERSLEIFKNFVSLC